MWAEGWFHPRKLSNTTYRKACMLHAMGKDSGRVIPSGDDNLVASTKVGDPPPSEMDCC